MVGKSSSLHILVSLCRLIQEARNLGFLLQTVDVFAIVALSGIVSRLLSTGTVLVATSNRAPRDLNQVCLCTNFQDDGLLLSWFHSQQRKKYIFLSRMGCKKRYLKTFLPKWRSIVKMF